MREHPRAHPYARSIGRLLEQEGFTNIVLEEEVEKALWKTAGEAHINFDIAYLALNPLPHREYIECKARDNGNRIGAEHVGKFIADLQTCGLDYDHGLMVANTGYEPGAIDRARSRGVRLYVVRTADLVTPTKKTYSLIARPKAILENVKRQLRGDNNLPHAFKRIA